VYSSLAGRSFVPALVAAGDGVLVTEALSPDGWVGEWTPELVAATRAVLAEVHGSPVPVGVPAVGAVANPWVAIAADPARLLTRGVCGQSWLDGSLDVLRAAAEQAPTAGDCLVHRDVCAANLWSRDGRVVLADWSAAGVGDPWFDVHLWLVALHAEGGPPPEAGQGPDAAGQAALIAGLQVLLAPARDADPVLFGLRRRRLVVALSWAARLSGLPSPA
jgi:aminoglycoside phosphotransferase (APT) family kinase protein